MLTLVALQFAGDAALGPVRHAAPIRVDQAAEKRSRMVVDDLPLPILECDRAGVFSAGTVLREETGPVFGVTLDLGAADALDGRHLRHGKHRAQGGLHLRPDAWPRVGAEDREAVHVAPAGSDVAVAQVLPEQVG